MGGKVLKLKTDELIEQGEERINNLNRHLSEDGRIDDLCKSCTDKDYQKELLKEYGIL